jgi:16S rRNA (adenine1518-N6/adenine1519-N6)-dimethyltransferase
VKRTCFYPVPEVESAVVSLTPRSAPLVAKEMEVDFSRVVHGAFAHRRKTVENSLADARIVVSKDDAIAALNGAGLSPGRRAESLTVEEFFALTRQLMSGSEP